uniref:Unkown protein n=1 Tax=Riptortus pedestris TaxID=329032 RepID=R4WE68_RIPPE|nr:unkown protein [Riptortus pedestris]
MSLCRVGLRAVRQGGRRMASGSAPVHPGYNATEPVKHRFSVEDGNPIFVKAGGTDRILYGLTAATCVVAIGLNVKLYWELSLK